jgi:glycerol kinase
MGAAFMAGLGAGIFENMEVLKSMCVVQHHFKPRPSAGVMEGYSRWLEELSRT